MQKFIRKIAWYSFFVIATFFLVSKIVDFGLRSSEALVWRNWNDIYKGNINADILIMGSSRAETQFQPWIIDSITGMNSFNIGISGHEFTIQYCKYKFYREFNCKPEIIIQNVDAATFGKAENLYTYEQFLPYLSDTIIHKYTRRYNGFSWIDYNLPLFKYFGAQRALIIGLAQYLPFKKIKDYPYHVKYYKGYHEQHENLINEDAVRLKLKKNNSTLQEFEKFVCQCKSDTIKLILVHTPVLQQKHDQNKEYIRQIQEIADNYSLLFMNYLNDSLCYNEKSFYDPVHLNVKGAGVFSTRFSNDLMDMLNVPEVAQSQNKLYSIRNIHNGKN